jgi:hypothetical protein
MKIIKNLLPIAAFMQQIVEAIKNNRVVIIPAETSAGKSTQVPQYIMDMLGWNVVCTQPRTIIARKTGERVAAEQNVTFGTNVAFKAGKGQGNESPETKILYVTDGLQMIHEINNHTKWSLSTGRKLVVCIDEAHLWSASIEALVAYYAQLFDQGIDFRLVIMSATIDYEGLAGFFGGAPVIRVPGRSFRVIGSPKDVDGIKQRPAKDLIPGIAEKLKQGKDGLVFLPGKGEIADVHRGLTETCRKENIIVDIFPLHGDLEQHEQDSAFKPVKGRKVVLATNIAESGLTPPDCDFVADTGVEKMMLVKNGVQSLTLVNVAIANLIQRAGRTGRIGEGEYCLYNDTPFSQFEKFPIPEIKRVFLDQMVLRFIEMGLDPFNLRFYHQPEKSALLAAKKTLYGLGCIDSTGMVTRTGKYALLFPVNVNVAVMIMQSMKEGCLDQMLLAAAIMCTRFGTLNRSPKEDDPDHYLNIRSELKGLAGYNSDALLEVEMFHAAKSMKYSEFIENGISPAAYDAALDNLRQFHEVLKRLNINMKSCSFNSNEVAIRKSIAAGMVDGLYQKHERDEYRDHDTNLLHKLDNKSAVRVGAPWIVGVPKRLPGKRNGVTIIENVTVVEPGWFINIAPHLCESKIENIRFESTVEVSAVIADEVLYLSGAEIAREKHLPLYSTENFKVFMDALMAGRFSSESALGRVHTANMLTLTKYSELRLRSGNSIPEIARENLREKYENIFLPAFQNNPGVKTSMYVLDVLLNGFGSVLFLMESYISWKGEQDVLLSNPDSIEINGQKLAVSYTSLTPAVSITEAQLEMASWDSCVLPSGRACEFRCGNQKHTSINELKAASDDERVTRLISAANAVHSKDFHALSINDLPEDFLTEILIAVRRGGSEVKRVKGFQNQGGSFSTKLFEDFSDAEIATKTALRVFFSTQVAKVASVPKVSPWAESWGTKTALGLLLEKRFAELGNLPLDISVPKIKEQFSKLSDLVPQVMEEVFQVQVNLDKLRTEINEKSAQLDNLDFVYHEKYDFTQTKYEFEQKVQEVNECESKKLYNDLISRIEEIIELNKKRINDSINRKTIAENYISELRKIINGEGKYTDEKADEGKKFIPSNADTRSAYRYINEINYYIDERYIDDRIEEYLEKARLLIEDLDKYIKGLNTIEDMPITKSKVIIKEKLNKDTPFGDLAGLENLFGGEAIIK